MSFIFLHSASFLKLPWYNTLLKGQVKVLGFFHESVDLPHMMLSRSHIDSWVLEVVLGDLCVNLIAMTHDLSDPL